MRTIRDVEVRTIGTEYKRHAQLTTSCGVRFALCNCPRHHSKEAGLTRLFSLPGIGQAVCWKALNVFRRVLRSQLAAVTH
jgi:hypothetical protein